MVKICSALQLIFMFVKVFFYKTLYKDTCVRISLNLQGYPIEITIDMLSYPSPSTIQKLYEIHKQGEFINAL